MPAVEQRKPAFSTTSALSFPALALSHCLSRARSRTCSPGSRTGPASPSGATKPAGAGWASPTSPPPSSTCVSRSPVTDPSTTVALPILRVLFIMIDLLSVAAAYVYSGQLGLGLRVKMAADINLRGKRNCSASPPGAALSRRGAPLLLCGAGRGDAAEQLERAETRLRGDVVEGERDRARQRQRPGPVHLLQLRAFAGVGVGLG